MLPSSWMATIALKKNQMQKGDGHREGKNVLDPIVEHCVKTGVRALTVLHFRVKIGIDHNMKSICL